MAPPVLTHDLALEIQDFTSRKSQQMCSAWTYTKRTPNETEQVTEKVEQRKKCMTAKKQNQAFKIVASHRKNLPKSQANKSVAAGAQQKSDKDGENLSEI